ncbi:FMN-dependent oxidoreductase (nitrilotriacetate monooxygenase family) [Acidovorax sp. 56]|uniref:LLM class flavin-dependent oxidoreductase n=1 Tax=Acidovorax sp. 56 TaxID=2035205 RepID=UPI000C170584|nr:LLM class flavin-dependent oxidoreductase [Acidovorax sp. 56]PIF27292.1 FMN-dependent oxidoreductase (nitrilotriacetate monooxygenase family) [Acidovorax sp. 56]
MSPTPTTRQRKPIVLNAFNMNCVGHINHGLWTHPRDRSTEYNTLPYWTDLARTLERGLFDGLFIADIVGVYDVYQAGIDLTLRESIQLPVNDPVVLVSAMAAVTQHLGFGVTVNPTTEHPYLLARRFGTLDHLTTGRIGWNVVTGYLDSAARAIGLPQQIGHDDRYDQAEEFLDVFYQLLEGSWRDDAVKADKGARIYTDPAAVRKIAHHGHHYQVEGVNLTAPSLQRTPVIYQAGTSDRGKAFAARHAEAVFISGNNKALVRESVVALRQAAADAGRAPEDLKIVLGVSVVPGRTEAEARDKDAEYRRYANPEAGLAHFAAGTGIDFARYGLDEPIAYGQTNSIQSAVALAKRQGWTRRGMLEQYALGGRYPAIVGTGDQVADALQSWVDDTGVDGFNLTRTVVPESFEDFIDIVVPELQNRGLHKSSYTQGSLRHKLFGKGNRLPDQHPAARWRHAAPAAAHPPATAHSTTPTTTPTTEESPA